MSRLLMHGYSLWNGWLGLPGGGGILKAAANRLESLRSWPLPLPEGQRIHVDFRDLSAFGWWRLIHGKPIQEESLVRAICGLGIKNPVFWDVGANCGLVSYRIRQQIPVQEHHLFEPNTAMLTMAREALGPFENVQGYDLALSDRENTGLMESPPGESAKGKVVVGNSEPETRGLGTISVKTGDQLVQEQLIPAPQVVKIDTEGHDLRVIAGMRQTIAQHRPVIFFECLDFSDEELNASTPNGYTLRSIAPTGEILPTFQRESGHNAVLWPEGKS